MSIDPDLQSQLPPPARDGNQCDRETGDCLVAATALACSTVAVQQPRVTPAWELLLAMAEANSVSQLLRVGLQRGGHAVPPAIEMRLRGRCQARALHGMAMKAELLRLLRQFAEQGIEVMPIKGPLLAELAYPQPQLRESADLDLLVHPADRPRALELLRELGYHSPYRNVDLHQRYHIVCMHQGSGWIVELHWRVAGFEYPVFKSGEFLWQDCIRASLLGVPYCQPRPEHLFAYLCIHAFKHDWERLLWLHDLPCLLAASPQFDWQRLQACAAAIGAGRIVAAALQLALVYYPDAMRAAGAPIQPGPLRPRQLERVRQRLYSCSRTHGELRDLLRLRIPLLQGTRDRLRFLTARFLPSDRDLESVRLPRWLRPLYVLVRPFRIWSDYRRGALPRQRPGGDHDIDQRR